MKNEQNDQKQRDQNIKKPSANNQRDQMQQNNNQSRPQHSPPGNEKSNLSVDNDGKLGKRHEQWNNE